MNELEKLIESGLLDEETANSLKEAINSKVSSKLEEEKEKLREEFARRYEHDKKVMVEAADTMFNENLEKELEELKEERQNAIEAKVRYKKMIREHAKAFNKFAANKLHGEISELRNDRKGLAEALMKFEEFAVKQISRELTEFHQDKRDLVETKVKLYKEAKGKIEETRKNFVQKASVIAEAKIEEFLRKEFTRFRKDIKESKKNHFGRRLFEAFAAEFYASHLADGTQIKKLMNAVKERDHKLDEAMKQIEKNKKLLENTQSKQRIAENRLIRHKKLDELLSPLPKEKRRLMAELLESVETNRLDESYKKHLKYVLREDSVDSTKKTLSEGKENNKKSVVTGNKKQIYENADNDGMNEDEILKIKKLAGIN